MQPAPGPISPSQPEAPLPPARTRRSAHGVPSDTAAPIPPYVRSVPGSEADANRAASGGLLLEGVSGPAAEAPGPSRRMGGPAVEEWQPPVDESPEGGSDAAGASESPRPEGELLPWEQFPAGAEADVMVEPEPADGDFLLAPASAVSEADALADSLADRLEALAARLRVEGMEPLLRPDDTAAGVERLLAILLAGHLSR